MSMLLRKLFFTLLRSACISFVLVCLYSWFVTLTNDQFRIDVEWVCAFITAIQVVVILDERPDSLRKRNREE